jgi:hypothetical protein
MQSLVAAKQDAFLLCLTPLHALFPCWVHVYRAGELYARYQLLSGEMPRQLPAIFENRDELAMQLRELGLLNEAAMVVLSDAESDLAFRVVLSPDLRHSFGFDGPAETIN